MKTEAPPLPHDHEAERIVAAYLVANGDDREGADAVCAITGDRDFDHPQWRKVLEAVTYLRNEAVAVTAAEVAATLHAWGIAKPDLRDLQRLALEVDAGKTAALAAARRLRDVRKWRSLVALGRDWERSWRHGGSTVDAAINHGVVDLHELASSTSQPFITLDVVLREREQELRDNIGKPVRRALTGFVPLDRLVGGFGRGELIVLAAETGGGKSAFATTILDEMAKRGQPILIASAEMEAWEIGDRILSRSCRIPGAQIRDHALDAEDLDAVHGRVVDESNARIHIMERRGAMTVQGIGAVARTVQRRSGLGMVVVDYLQLVTSLMSPHERGRNRQAEVGAVARGLKNMAAELGCPVLALSQFNRDAARDGGEPELHHLRDSGEIEHAANQVLFLWRPNEEDRDTLMLICKKHRAGAINKRVTLDFNRQFMSFALKPSLVQTGAA